MIREKEQKDISKPKSLLLISHRVSWRRKKKKNKEDPSKIIYRINFKDKGILRCIKRNYRISKELFWKNNNWFGIIDGKRTKRMVNETIRKRL